MKQNTKDWIQYSSAGLLIVAAISMGFVSLALTMEIGSGPLAYIFQTLSAALAIFGISTWAVNKVGEISREMRNELNQVRTNNESVNNEANDNK
ncbi:MAG: hypothetical protein IJS95_08965 [Prevotella sp.]|nr:hypothetical protein [Prevotella sp.]